MGLEEKVNIRICPILREKDGLAMSSRNVRLAKKNVQRLLHFMKH